MFRGWNVHIVALVLATLLGGGATVLAQGDGAPEAYMTGETRPVDMIVARRLLMNAVGRKNDYLHDTIDGHFTWDDEAVRTRLDDMAMMLTAFPHLYHPDTDRWSEELEAENSATVSLSTAAVWDEFDSFYALAESASQIAVEAAFARERKDIEELVIELEQVCDSCHERYRQPRTSSLEEALGDF